jgi:hypothetical protein
MSTFQLYALLADPELYVTALKFRRGKTDISAGLRVREICAASLDCPNEALLLQAPFMRPSENVPRKRSRAASAA